MKRFWLTGATAALILLAAGPAIARADSTAVLQAQLDQQAAQLRMQQQLNTQQQSLNDRQFQLQNEQNANLLELRYRLDQQNAKLGTILQQGQLSLLQLQQSMKPLDPKLLVKPPNPPAPLPKP